MRGDGIVTILSSDHYINQARKMLNNIKDAIQVASKSENLVVIGIKPTYPASGFGYIKIMTEENKKYYKVEKFIQKPNSDKAKELLESGMYYWNSGMYIWKIETILKNYKKYLPELYKYNDEIERVIGTCEGKRVIKKIYNEIESVSIDKGILEKSNKIKMIKGDFEWMDIGSINDFFKIKSKNENNNVKIGNVISEEITNTNFFNANEDCLVATIGLDGINIINCNKVLLIANKNKMNKLPEFLERIKEDEELKKFL